jgi:ribosomal protein S18 acetylase RimI-like enzyme
MLTSVVAWYVRADSRQALGYPECMRDLKFVDITDIRDDLLPAWLDLYEVSFPPEEKVLVSQFLELLRDKANGLREHSHMMAALDETGKLVGIMRSDDLREPGVAYLWYLAVDPNARGKGLGRACHEETLRRCREAGARAAVMEVEIPDESPDPEFARRRIEFYRRHGALMLTGIHYVHRAAPHLPAINMHILVRPFEDITPEDAFDFACALFGDDAVTRVGELGLE